MEKQSNPIHCFHHILKPGNLFKFEKDPALYRCVSNTKKELSYSDAFGNTRTIDTEFTAIPIIYFKD